MEIAFYLSGFIAVLATILVIVNPNPVHALMYLVTSLLAVACVFFTLGAPFAAALEVIVYAGAIMVLFVFVVMMLNLGETVTQQEQAWLKPSVWIGPGILCALLLFPLMRLMLGGEHTPAGVTEVGAKAVGVSLYGPYLLAVELASMMLTAGLVAAYHLGKQD
ncbi:NADH-quinone oxidoreductase subunit J [Panacagrimonas sp.]|uniref:NADH-quinone oxidoreductase subunit J n=1 Tax=Panacagrimonas sp. TaxID=2480088 RepID=UPI003B518F80